MKNWPLKESLFIGFCAVFLVASRAALRWKLGISGHSMFFIVFFLMLARGCVPLRGAATMTGALAGLMSIILGLGKGGPLLLLKFVLPALVIDLGAWLLPAFFFGYGGCAMVAIAASFSKFIGTAAVDLLMGMDRAIILQHALLESIFAIPFGLLGAMLVPPVLHRLQAFDVIKPQPKGSPHEDSRLS